MNNVERIAEMLGVEIGEHFNLINGEGYSLSMPFYFNENGLYAEDLNMPQHAILGQIVLGIYTIEKVPFKPKLGENFCYVTDNGTIISTWNNKETFVMNFYKIGNCYRTKKEAEANREKWVEFYKDDKQLTIP